MKTITIDGKKYIGSNHYGYLYGYDITIDELYQTWINKMDASLYDLDRKNSKDFKNWIKENFN